MIYIWQILPWQGFVKRAIGMTEPRDAYTLAKSQVKRTEKKNEEKKWGKGEKKPTICHAVCILNILHYIMIILTVPMQVRNPPLCGDHRYAGLPEKQEQEKEVVFVKTQSTRDLRQGKRRKNAVWFTLQVNFRSKRPCFAKAHNMWSRNPIPVFTSDCTERRRRRKKKERKKETPTATTTSEYNNFSYCAKTCFIQT